MKTFRIRALCLLAPALLLGFVPAAGARTSVGIRVNLGGLAWSLVSGCHGARVAVAAPPVFFAPRPVVCRPPGIYAPPPRVVFAPPPPPVILPRPPGIFAPPLVLPVPRLFQPPRGSSPHAYRGHHPLRRPIPRTAGGISRGRR